MLAGVDINGGLSWNGWTNRGLSNQGGLYGSGGTTGRDTYEVYTTTFAFAGNAIEKNPVQAVAPAPEGFDSGRFAPIPGGRQIQVSAGAFQAGNTILGIGVRATTSDGSIAGFWPTIRFDLDNDSYRPASFEVDSAGRTIKLNNDGRTSFTTYAEPGDFTVQFEGSASWRGSSINVREAATAQLPAATVQLPGGVGSGTSYDFAFRAFAQPAANSYQMFLDMTAIPSLYGSVYRTFFPARAGVGTIGDRVTVSLNGLGSNNVVFDANVTLPAVDLDVDSNNDGTIDPDNGLVGTDDRIEDDTTLPGVIVPVGGSRAKMVVDVPAGRTATLAFDAAAAAKVKVFANSGAVVLEQGRLSTAIAGGTTALTFWIQAFAPSASLADIAFTLTPTGGSPASSDRIRATAVAVDLDVGLDLEIVESGGILSADHAGAWYGADATIAFGPSPLPMPAPDGTVIEWTTTRPTGQGSTIRTPTTRGYASFLMQAGTRAGDVYGVSARVVEIPFAGTVLRLPSRANAGDSVIVVPGIAAAYEYAWSRPSIAADGKSRSEATVTIRDRFGNLVADGTSVAWTLNGAATIVSGDTQTTAGKARALIQATDLAGTVALTATADGTDGTGSCDVAAVNIALTATSQRAVLGSDDAIQLTARVTDATGAPVADGTPIHWFSRCGRIAGAATVQNGVARATLTVRDGTLRAGNHVVAALVGRAVGKVIFQFTSPDGRLFATVDQALLAGDVVEDGTLPVEQLDGTSIDRPYLHETVGYVFNGPANGIVRVAFDAASAARGLVTINGHEDRADVMCGPDGTATFRIGSTGVFRGNGIVRVRLTATVVADGTGQRVDPFTADRTWGQWTWGMAVAARDTAAYCVDTVAHVGWGVLTGEADSNAALLGDVGVSVIPAVGVLPDVRDILKELCFMLPGGREPDTLVLTLSLIGVAAELFPPADYLPDALKTLAKVLKVQGPFFQAVQAIAERAWKTGTFDEVRDFKALLSHLTLPPDITTLRFLDDSIIKSADDLARLNRLSTLTDPGTIVGLLKRVGERHGAEQATRLFGNLATLSDVQLTVLKDANRLNLVGEAVAKAGWGSSQLGKYADNVKELKPNNPALKLFDEFADVTGSGSYLTKKAKLLDDVGVQNELKVAKIKRDSGDPITELQFEIDTPGVAGEIDVVSKKCAIEVKTSPNNGKLKNWKDQVMRLVNYAKANDLKAEYWYENTIHPDRYDFLIQNGVRPVKIP